MELLIATKNHKDGLYQQGKVYKSSDRDEKRNQVFVADERGIGCWYSWEDFVLLDNFNKTMKLFEVTKDSYYDNRKI